MPTVCKGEDCNPGPTGTTPAPGEPEEGDPTTPATGTEEPCKEMPNLPAGAKGCVTPDDIEFEFDFSYCSEPAELMWFEIEIEGAEAIVVVTIDVDDNVTPYLVSWSTYASIFLNCWQTSSCLIFAFY